MNFTKEIYVQINDQSNVETKFCCMSFPYVDQSSFFLYSILFIFLNFSRVHLYGGSRCFEQL